MSGQDVERELLGAVLVRPELLGPVADVIVPGDFYRVGHQRIWETVLSLDEDGRPVDLVSLRVGLAEAGALEAVGGAAALGALVDGMPAVGEKAAVAWARSVRARARVRRLAAGLEGLLREAKGDEASADELVAGVERLLSQEEAPTSAVLDRAEVAASTWALLRDEVEGKALGIPSGLPGLDRHLRCGGWRPGQLAYIGARTSRGKSALLLGFAEAAAAAGHGVLFFPLEMSPEEMGGRRLIAHSGVSLAHLHSWREQERERALGELAQSRPILERPLDFAGKRARSLGAIRAACRRHKARHGLGLVCVDYLGLVELERAGRASLYERTTAVSQGLKQLAIELGVPVLCAVQLNREPAQNGRPTRPSLAHFRDSGAIEQDCDLALLIHQAESTDAIVEGPCELLVSKQRNGWTGSVSLRWRSVCARFESPALEGVA